MTEQRPGLRTPGSTVAAAERIVAWLKTALQGKTPDRADVVERHIGQFNSPEEVKRYLSGRTGCIRVAALRHVTRNGHSARIRFQTRPGRSAGQGRHPVQ
ncbi:hypothetical protein QT333_01745 [Escherichia coli]|nr:hypothetical protein [Escherichia coli]